MMIHWLLAAWSLQACLDFAQAKYVNKGWHESEHFWNKSCSSIQQTFVFKKTMSHTSAQSETGKTNSPSFSLSCLNYQCTKTAPYANVTSVTFYDNSSSTLSCLSKIGENFTAVIQQRFNTDCVTNPNDTRRIVFFNSSINYGCHSEMPTVQTIKIMFGCFQMISTSTVLSKPTSETRRELVSTSASLGTLEVTKDADSLLPILLGCLAGCLIISGAVILLHKKRKLHCYRKPRTPIIGQRKNDYQEEISDVPKKSSSALNKGNMANRVQLPAENSRAYHDSPEQSETYYEPVDYTYMVVNNTSIKSATTVANDISSNSRQSDREKVVVVENELYSTEE